MEWIAHDVRVLEDFCQTGQGPDLMKSTCLLRLVDALHRSRVRTGSAARRATHKLYRNNRKKWVEKRRREVQRLLRDMPVGSAPYVELLQELFALESYEDLLQAQEAHLWYHSIVRKVSARYVHRQGAIVVSYQLSDTEGWDCTNVAKALRQRFPRRRQESAVWRASLKDDVWHSELGGQGRGKASEGRLPQTVFESVDLRLVTDVATEAKPRRPTRFFSLVEYCGSESAG